MNQFRKLVLASALLAISVAALASPNLVGKWNGHITSFPNMPKASTPQEQKQVSAMMAKIKKMVITINLKSNKTFTATVTGFPMGGVDKKTQTGTWSLNGSTLSLTGKESNGKSHTQTFDLAKNGRSFSTSQMGATVLFKKA